VNWHFHCYHKIKGSERKLKSFSTCKRENPYISWNGASVRYTIELKCCICGKKRESHTYWDYDIEGALKYKSKDEGEY